MGLLQRFENRLEAVVSGAFAKAFRSSVQPVELSAALNREVDNNAQVLSRDRRLVPNEFHIELSAADYDRLAPYLTSLTTELTDLLREHAEEQSYVFAGPVGIEFRQSAELTTGRFHVRSKASAAVDLPLHQPAPPETPGGPGAVAPAAVVAMLEVNGARTELRPPGLVVGRGAEADLRINDPGVSRRHAEIRVSTGAARPTVTIVDLGSTNGTLVNGYKVDRAALTEGGQVKIGNTTLTVTFERVSSPDETQAPAGGEGGE